MCEFKGISGSKITARFLMVVLEATAMPSRLAISLNNELLWCFGLSSVISVLFEFSYWKITGQLSLYVLRTKSSRCLQGATIAFLMNIMLGNTTFV